MLDFEPTRIDPVAKSAEELFLPDELDVSFEGWSPEVFALLERLREHPRIEQYRQEKPVIEEHLKAPFKRYRDDLVVNWVLPNRLDYETEKHVFSRLLKNDFGAGGCHHHKWLAFYRPGRRRLTDLQLSHSIHPDDFTVGLFVGEYGKELLQQAKERMADQPARFLDHLNPLLDDGWAFSYYRGAGTSKERTRHTEPLDALPDEVQQAKGIQVRRRFAREEVLQWESDLVRRALHAVCSVWPIYRFVGRREV